MRHLPTFVLMSLLWPFGLVGQSYQLADCQRLATEQSPLQANVAWQEQLFTLQQAQTKSQYLPQLGLNGQVAYQSDVVTFPKLGPDLTFPTIPQTQFRIVAEANQVIYAGGGRKQQADQQLADYQLRQNQLQSQLYPIRQRINQLFFAVLMLERQGKVLASNQEELAARRKVLEAGVEEGVRLASELAKFDQRQLQLRQQQRQLAAEASSARKMLAELMGVSGLEEGELALPVFFPPTAAAPKGQRPELEQMTSQREVLQQQMLATQSRLRPVVSAFAMGGVGQPNPFNFLNVDVSGFYQLGLRFQWTPWDWQQSKRQREMLGIQQQMVNTQEAQFNEGIRLQQIQEEETQASLQQLLEEDQALLDLQTKIVEQAAAQLGQGVIPAADYLAELETQTQLQLQQEQHRIQLLQSQAQWAYLLGE